MREVKKWSRDITGRVIEENVFKPNNGLIGRAKIEVRDENGNLKQEVFTENVIPETLNRGDFYQQLFNYIDGGGSYYQSRRRSGGIATVPYAFDRIILSTDDKEENAENLFLRGDLVGWCPRANASAGSDTTRGVYNSTESFSKFTEDGYIQYHLVYDFGTSQGNGTFNSVWWNRGGIVREGSNYFSPTHPVSLQLLTNAYGRNLSTNIVRGANKKYYAVDSSYNNPKEILNLERYLNGIEDIKTKADNYSGFQFSKYLMENGQVALAENGQYTGGSNTSWTGSFDVVIRNADDNSEISRKTIDLRSAVENWEETFYPSGTGKYCRLYNHPITMPNGDMMIYFEVYDYQTSSANQRIPIWDITNDDLSKTSFSYSNYCMGIYNAISNTWVLRPGITRESFAGYHRYHSYDHNFWLGKRPTSSSRATTFYSIFNYCRDMFEKDGKIYMLCTTDNYCLAVMSKGDYSKISPYQCGCMQTNDSTGLGFICYIEEYNLFISTAQEYYNSLYSNVWRIVPYSAHTKLPAPVTKTSADTMKIQYDYYIQVPKAISKDGDFITMPV